MRVNLMAPPRRWFVACAVILALVITACSSGVTTEEFDQINAELVDVRGQLNILDDLRNQVANLETRLAALSAHSTSANNRIAGLLVNRERLALDLAQVRDDLSRLAYGLEIAPVEAKIRIVELPEIFPGLDKRGGGAFYDSKSGSIYFLGGFRSDPQRIYKIDTDTWKTEVLVTTTPVHGESAYGWDGESFYIGGGPTVPIEGYATDKIYRFRPANGTMTEVGVLPQTLLDPVGVWNPDESKFYILGGYEGGGGPFGDGGSYRNNIQVFDPKEGTVKKVGELPRNADNPAAVYDPDKRVIYLIGGHAHGLFYDDIYEVLPHGSTKKVGALPEPLDYMGAFYYKGYVYIVGGRNDTTRSEAADTIYRFNTITGEVIELDLKLPKPNLIYSYAFNENTLFLINASPPMMLIFE